MATKPKPSNYTELKSYFDELEDWRDMWWTVPPDEQPPEEKEKAALQVELWLSVYIHRLLVELGYRNDQWMNPELEAVIESINAGRAWLAEFKGRVAVYRDAMERRLPPKRPPTPGKFQVYTPRKHLERVLSLTEKVDVAIAELEVAGSYDHGTTPLQARGQDALMRQVRRRLREAGFKPSELPLTLQMRRNGKPVQRVDIRRADIPRGVRGAAQPDLPRHPELSELSPVTRRR